jgi:hypothetical protein
MSRAPRSALYLKLAGVFTLCAVGGPLLMYAVTPDPDELFKRFSPELQKHNLENRDRRQAEYDDFRSKLIEYSKSDKPIWAAAKEAQEKARREIQERARGEESQRKEAVRGMREEMERGR